MDRRILPIVLVFFLMAAPIVAAQDGGASDGADAAPAKVTIDLEGHATGGFYFTLAGQSVKNPDLVVPAGAEVTINFLSVDGFHNLHVEGQPASDYVSDGESTSITFTAPASGTLPYWCDPHKSSGMQGKIVVQAAGGAPADTGAPAPDAPTSFKLEGHADNGAFFFTLEGQTAHNPTLTVPASTEITITFTSVTGFHNLHVEGFPASAYVSDGETTTVTFTSPASGSITYWCDPHKSSGMGGKIQVAGAGGAPAAGSGSASNPDEIHGPTVDLGTLGYPECSGFLIPKAAAEDNVGNPTVADYVDQCRAAASGSETQGGHVVEKHPADFVLPIMWALVFGGIVTIVWVNRKYNP